MPSSKEIPKEIELPQFLSTNPECWLETVEAMLTLRNYDNEQKYEYIKRHLCDGVNDDIIGNFEDESRRDGYMGDMYLGLRQYIMKQKQELQVFTFACVESFTSNDMKPSAFLKVVSRVMTASPKSVIRTVWLARLPRQIQRVMMLAILQDPLPMENWNLNSLAELADGIATYEKYYSYSMMLDDDTNSIPAYIENDPELWFYLLDEAFARENITSDTVKFESAIKVLRTHDILTASLFLTEMPNSVIFNHYENLRERVIKTFAVIKGDAIYRLIFRNKDGLKPSELFYLLNDIAAKTGKVVSQLLIRTLWIMHLPIKTQILLFEVIAASRELLEELEISALCMLADDVESSTRRLSTLFTAGQVLDRYGRHMMDKDLGMAKTLHEKIAAGARYCDFMYREYYDPCSSESGSSGNMATFSA